LGVGWGGVNQHPPHRDGAGRGSQRREFRCVIWIDRVAYTDADEHSTLAALGTFK
jgi:hypothetical protein